MVDKAHNVFLREFSLGQPGDHQGVVTGSVDEGVDESLRGAHALEVHLVADQQEDHTYEVEVGLSLEIVSVEEGHPVERASASETFVVLGVETHGDEVDAEEHGQDQYTVEDVLEVEGEEGTQEAQFRPGNTHRHLSLVHWFGTAGTELIQVLHFAHLVGQSVFVG